MGNRWEYLDRWGEIRLEHQDPCWTCSNFDHIEHYRTLWLWGCPVRPRSRWTELVLAFVLPLGHIRQSSLEYFQPSIGSNLNRCCHLEQQACICPQLAHNLAILFLWAWRKLPCPCSWPQKRQSLELVGSMEWSHHRLGQDCCRCHKEDTSMEFGFSWPQHLEFYRWLQQQPSWRTRCT